VRVYGCGCGCVCCPVTGSGDISSPVEVKTVISTAVLLLVDGFAAVSAHAVTRCEALLCLLWVVPPRAHSFELACQGTKLTRFSFHWYRTETCMCGCLPPKRTSAPPQQLSEVLAPRGFSALGSHFLLACLLPLFPLLGRNTNPRCMPSCLCSIKA